MSETMILKVLVGSRAHGTATEFSDWDHRGVFLRPTAEYFDLGGQKPKDTGWVEGRVDQAHEKKDDTSWELGHFLSLATQCNPSILEVFAAPRVETTPLGDELCDLFPWIWTPKRVVDAFCGYGANQRKKLLSDEPDERLPEAQRKRKYAQAWFRVLLQAEHLLAHRRLPVGLTTHPEFQTLMLIRAGAMTVGQVVDLCQALEAKVRALGRVCDQVPNLGAVSQWYAAVRERNWRQVDASQRMAT